MKNIRPQRTGKLISSTKPLEVTTHSFCHYTGFYPEVEIAAPTVLWVGYFIAKKEEIPF